MVFFDNRSVIILEGIIGLMVSLIVNGRKDYIIHFFSNLCLLEDVSSSNSPEPYFHKSYRAHDS